MVITFFGHSDYSYNGNDINSQSDEEKILNFLENTIDNKDCIFYLGGYGSFDKFAKDCCLKYKEKHSNCKLIFVLPYLNREYNINDYDETLYPQLEKVPKKFAIAERNKWMISQADYIVCYAYHIGKARDFLEFALKKNKRIFNLAKNINKT